MGTYVGYGDGAHVTIRGARASIYGFLLKTIQVNKDTKLSSRGFGDVYACATLVYFLRK